MYLILLGQNGARIDAILLAASRNRMRVTTPGCSDTIELRFNKAWISEDGGIREIEAMILDDVFEFSASPCF
jgi:hypothetical protein